MKAWKIIIVALIGIFLIAAVTIISIISSAGIQTALINRLLPPLVSVEKAHLGFRGLTLENLRFEEEGTLFITRRVRADFPLIRTIRTRKLDLRELAVEGVLLDLRQWQPSPEPRQREEMPPTIEAGEPFQGVLAPLPPWPKLTVDKLNLQGRILLPGGEEEIDFRASANEFSTMGEHTLRLEANYRSDNPDTFFQRISSSPQLTLSFDAERKLQRLSAEAPARLEIVLAGEQEVHHLRAILGLEYSPTNQLETYHAKLAHAIGENDEITLTRFNGMYGQESDFLEGDWEVTLDTANAGNLPYPWLRGSHLSAVGHGTFGVQPQTGRGGLAYDLALAVADLQNFDPRLAGSPQLQLDTEGRMTLSMDEATLEAFVFSLRDPKAEAPFLQASATQAFGLSLSDFSPIVTKPKEPVFSLEVHKLPGPLVNAFLPDHELTLGEVEGAFSLALENGFYRLETLTPLSIHILNFASIENGPLGENLTLRAEPALRGTETGWNLGWASLGLWQEDQNLLQSEAEFLWPHQQNDPFHGHLGWTVNLPRLLAQPFGEPFRNLRSGQWQGNLEFEGSESSIKGQSRLGFSQMVLRRGNESLDSLILESAFALESTGKGWGFQVPLHLRSDNQHSELNLSGTLNFGTPPGFSARLHGVELAAQPLVFLSKAFANPDYVGPEPSPEPDEAPIWAPWQGDLILSFNRVHGWGGPDLEDLQARFEIRETEAELTEFRTTTAGASAQANAKLRFRPDEQTMPYFLTGEFTLPEFSFDSWFRQRNPDQTPILEGRLNLKATTQAEAPNLAFLADRVTGDFSLDASDIVVRALGRGQASGTMDTIAAVGQIGGLLTGRRELESISTLTSYFRRLEIEEFSLHASRKEDLSLELSRLLMRNQDLFLQGQGRIPYEEGKSLWQMPLNLSFDLAVGPQLSGLFAELNLLKPEGESAPVENFRSLNRRLEIGGTVSDPDPRPMWRVFIDAGTNRLLRGR